MNKKTGIVLVVVGVVAAALVIFNSEKLPDTARKPKIAIFNLLSHPILNDSIKGIKAALAEEGFGAEDVQYLEVNANGEMDKLNAFAKELLAAQPDVIVPVSTPVTQAVFKEAPAMQKIVFSTVTNPSDVGMDGKPAHMTGVCDVVNYQASFDLIFEIAPNTKCIGIIYNAGERNSQYGVDRIKELATKRNVELQLVTVSQSQEVVDATKGLVGNVDVIYVGSDNTVVAAMAGVTRVAYESKIPVIASDSGSVTDGALAAVSVDYSNLGHRAGQIIAEILKSENMPADTSPVMFLGDKLMLNERAATKLAYQFPETLRARAEEIITKDE